MLKINEGNPARYQAAGQIGQTPAVLYEVTRQIEAMLANAWELAGQDPALGLAALHQAYETAEVNGSLAGQIKASNYLGRIQVRLGHYDRAFLHYSQAVELSEKTGDRRGAASAFIGIGLIYSMLGEYPTAQENYLAAYQYAAELMMAADAGGQEAASQEAVSAEPAVVEGQQPVVQAGPGLPATPEALAALALNNVAAAYIDSGEYDKAHEYLNKALPLARRANRPLTLNAVLDSLAELYYKTNRLDQALEYALESVELAHISDPEIGDNLITLGKIYLALGNQPKALVCFQEAVESSEVTQSHRPMIRAWVMIGVMHRLQGRQAESQAILVQAYQLALTEDTPLFQAECLLELSNGYKQSADFEKALECFEKYHDLKERIFNERSDMRLKTLEVLHQVESARKEAELFQLRTMELQHEIEERLKIEKDLEKMATHDSLTGLYNRWQFIHLAEMLSDQSTANQRPLSLILFDLDYFKHINDTYGHLAGDYALKVMADRIPGIVRKMDVVARVGGDEFAVLLPDTDLEQAYNIAERLRAEIAMTPVTYENQQIQLTLSLGVAEKLLNESSIDPFYARADKGLYVAKQKGRNRVRKFIREPLVGL